MEYEWIRSARRTIALEVKDSHRVIVRTPHRTPKRTVDEFLARHADWLEHALARTAERERKRSELYDPRRSAELQRSAEEYLPLRTAYWAQIMGVSPVGVRITGARTRYGSCSAKNRICYSRYLMAHPTDAVDYVIVHELAHILQKNHSARFYAIVARYLPDWKRRRAILRDI